MKSVAAVLHSPGSEFSIEPIELDEPQSGQVMVRITAVGVCHTDLIFANRAVGVPSPVILGHEGAGYVVSVGPDVDELTVGDKVVLAFESCGTCANCQSSDPAYCYDYAPLNFSCLDRHGASPARSADGTQIAARFFGQSSFATHAIVNAKNAVKLSPEADEAVLAPLGCGVQTGAGAVMRSLDAKAGSSLVVLGGGAVGLSAVMAAKVVGCSPIIVVEPNESRRALAMELGATLTIDPMTSEAVEIVRGQSPSGVEYLIDTSGNLKAIEDGIQMMAPKATFGFVGLPADQLSNLPVVVRSMIAGGLIFKGIISGDSVPQEFMPELVAMVESGQMPVEKMIKYYPFEDINQAIEDSRTGACIKPVLRMKMEDGK